MATDDEIAYAWVDRFHRVRSGELNLRSEEEDPTDVFSDEFLELCQSKTGYRRALGIILKIKDMDSSEYIMDGLSAGPLESIVTMHPVEVIDEIERLARRDQEFKELLRGVWNNGVPDDIWRRIENISCKK